MKRLMTIAFFGDGIVFYWIKAGIDAKSSIEVRYKAVRNHLKSLVLGVQSGERVLDGLQRLGGNEYALTCVCHQSPVLLSTQCNSLVTTEFSGVKMLAPCTK